MDITDIVCILIFLCGILFVCLAYTIDNKIWTIIDLVLAIISISFSISVLTQKTIE